jgi:Resolvase, N terminal domain
MEMEEPYLRNSRHLHQAWAADGIGLFRCKFLMQNPGMIYGYASVSTIAQDLASQLARLKAAGCEKVFREKVTGTTADRPQLTHQSIIKTTFLLYVMISGAIARE